MLTIREIRSVTYYGHRLAFLIMEGWMPDEVDHEDLNRSNNAWANIRPATRAEQNRNRPVQSRNKLGIKGVSFEYGRYRAKIRVDGRSMNLGSFTTEQAAIEAYATASRRHHGEFGRAS
ncbi:HNH endonuclease [Bradyrhizobium sp. USDA 241]|uniref:HNH endonuclease n=1 Tax=Bradyrhizobium sp. USDA 241 TaxID=3377725 RepID=UPI003C768921